MAKKRKPAQIEGGESKAFQKQEKSGKPRKQTKPSRSVKLD